MAVAIALVLIGAGLGLAAFKARVSHPFRLLLAAAGVVCLGFGAIAAAGIGAPGTPSLPAGASTSGSAPASSSPPAPAVARPVQPPAPGVGRIVSEKYLDVAVAGGRYLKVGGSRYLALQVYVRNKGTTTMLFGESMRVKDDSGASWRQDLRVLHGTTLRPLDTASHDLGYGESAAGWVAFGLDAGAVPVYLIIGNDITGSDFSQIWIALDGFDKVPANSEAAVAYARAAKVGAKRVP
jgi:hypothetical protein